jgi:hypothetical protein
MPRQRVNRWYSFKWFGGDNAEQRRQHNHVNRTTCPFCGSNDVYDIEDAEVMALHQAAANTLFGASEPKSGH